MNYWKKRAKQELLKTEKITEEVIDEIIKLYDDSSKDIQKQIKKIFYTYQKNSGLNKLELLKLLNQEENNEFYKDIRKKMDNPLYIDQRQELLNIYNSRAYAFRISRLMAIEENIYLEIAKLKGLEEKLTRKHYENLIIEKYKEKVNSDLFTKTTEQELKQIVNESWLGSNFSKRIWKEQKRLTKAINEIVKIGFFNGKSIKTISKELSEELDVSLFNATRLVRTESNYYHNQTELRILKDLGIKKYRYLAVLDSRTSCICRSLDGKVFDVKDAEVGVNFPPMHPFCRSTIINANLERK